MEHKRSNVIGAISIILTFLLVQVLSLVGVFLLSGLDPSYSLYAIISANLLGAFLVLYLNYRFNIIYFFEMNTEPIPKVITWGLIGTLLAYFSQILIVMFEIVLLGEPNVSANTESIMQVISSNPLFVLLPVLTAPIIEELVFRKAINGLLVSKIGWIGGAVVSSLLFAFVHFDGMILTYAVMGLIFSYVYYKTNNIWAPIIAHMGLNLLATVLNLMV